MPAERAELVNQGYMIRRDQVERIENFVGRRPGASASAVLRELLDYAFPVYEARTQMLEAFDQKAGVA